MTNNNNSTCINNNNNINLHQVLNHDVHCQQRMCHITDGATCVLLQNYPGGVEDSSRGDRTCCQSEATGGRDVRAKYIRACETYQSVKGSRRKKGVFYVALNAALSCGWSLNLFDRRRSVEGSTGLCHLSQHLQLLHL